MHQNRENQESYLIESDKIIQYLKDYPYAFMLISHDTEFMNQVVNVIYHLEFTKLSRYTANYEKFLEMSGVNKQQR